MRFLAVSTAIGAIALAAAAAAPALAADYPVLRGSQFDEPSPQPEMFSDAFSWSGFYIGGYAGQSQTNFRTDRGVMDLANGAFNAVSILSEISPGELVRTGARRDRGVTFGGFAGYNMAFGDAMIGFEADYTKVDQTTTASTLEARLVSTGSIRVASTQDATLNDYGSVRARFGYAFGRLMPYFTIGAAAGRFDTNIQVAAAYLDTNRNSYFGYPRTLGGPRKDVWGYGLSMGGGVEAALTDNIVLRGEYMFTRFNNVEGVTVNLNTARVAAALKF